MFSIKSSKYSDCSKCELLDAPSCILETNCEKDLSKVDILICAENPGKTEVEEGRPLVGKAGKLFRKYFDKYLSSFNYLLTNCVLCLTLKPDGTTGNPSDKVIEECKQNLFEIIRLCKPKLILSLGTSPMKAFGISKSGVSEIRGKIYKWENYDVLVTFHPSYIARNINRKDDKTSILFEEDIQLAASILKDEKIDTKTKTNDVNNIVGEGVFYYSIPKKYYSSDYRLVDVQYLYNKRKILYIFRDKDNNKEYYQTNDDFYCYTAKDHIDRKEMVLKYENLNQIKISPKERYYLDNNTTYEGDIKITDKHIIDYYLKTEDEYSDKDLNCLFIDIEIDTKESKEFPDPEQANYPICLISMSYHDSVVTYLLESQEHINLNRNRSDTNLKIFKDESYLIKTFIKDLKQIDPDIISGWNSNRFDLPYIYNRILKLQISDSLSKFGECIVSKENDFASIPGFVCIDMLKIYKEFNDKNPENFKLGTVAEVELKQTKIFLDEGITSIYYKNIEKFIEYNIRDVTILVDLEKRLKYIKFINELKKICNCSFQSCMSTFGRLDCLVISRFKKLGLSSKNKVDEESKAFPGAYVQEPIKGIHNYIVDLDFTSLYPSIIITYNIGLNTFVYKFEDFTDGYDFIYDFNNLKPKVKIIKDPIYNKKAIEINKEELLDIVRRENLVFTINGCFYKNHSTEKSLFSEILIDLMDCRKKMKKLMQECIDKKDIENELLYNTRQLAFKILANALYGVLGAKIFRFFNVDLATSVTLSGQEAIKISILNANKYMDELKRKENKSSDILKINKEQVYSNVMNVTTPYIITGDTDSLFATFNDFFPRSKKFEEILPLMIPMIDELQTYLNKNVVIEMVKLHNVDVKNSRLELKNELVIKRGLFIAKKRYANYVTLKEGKQIDKIKPMGLEIKRSDFSKYTKNCLNELLSIILTSENISIKKILNYTKEKEIEFAKRIKVGDRSICEPASYTKKLEEYKVIPMNVRGMLNWNKLMYDCFYTGSKGYLVKISGLDMQKAPQKVLDNYDKYFERTGEKLDCICFPDEEERLPEFFVPDLKRMLEFSWIDRYKLLLEPILQVENDFIVSR